MSADGANSSPQAGPIPARQPWWVGLVRPKGHIGPLTLSLLIALGCVPLIMAFTRILAFPGVEAPPIVGIDHLRALGNALNQWFSLEWVPPSDRPAILYLLLLPTGALLIALARLTFGLRVLGLRAILIAIGFQEAGFLPSLVLMAIVIAAIVAIRPGMQRIRLPLYARISAILCLTAIIMVAALLLGPWLRSEVVWSVAFFPVIIMAMLADGIARTLAKNNAVTAAWRAGWTIVVALVIALLSQIPAVRNIALHFPELMVTQLVAIVLISEFIDLRLLEHWPARLSSLVEGVRPWLTEKPKVAVVHNRWNAGVIGRLGRPASPKFRKRSVQWLVDALRDRGFKVRVFEGDVSLLRELQEFLPPDPRSGAPGGIALNCATGVQGIGQFCHVPAMLEMAGIAYTGPNPVTHTRLLDRYVLMTLLQQAGVPVARFTLMSNIAENIGDLPFPLLVRPRYEPDGGRNVVKDPATLADAVSRVLDHYAQDALIEEPVEGREIRASLLGNETIECLPLLERLSKGGRKLCPAPIDEALADRIRECAYNAYVAAGCRDYARIDVRVSKSSGEPKVVEVNWADIFARGGSFVRSAEAAGYSFADLMHRIVDEASRRYGVGSTPYAIPGQSGELSIVPINERRVAAK